MELIVGKDLELERNWNKQQKQVNYIMVQFILLPPLAILQKYTVTDKRVLVFSLKKISVENE